MNRKDRKRMTAAVQRYCSIVIPAFKELSNEIEDLKASEEEKLENIPGALQDSPQAGNIQEAADQLEEIQGSLETISDANDEIIDSAGIEMPSVTLPADSIVRDTDTDPRNNRYQILLSDQLLVLMKLRALQLGISGNELVCRALWDELVKDPNEQKRTPAKSNGTHHRLRQ